MASLRRALPAAVCKLCEAPQTLRRQACLPCVRCAGSLGPPERLQTEISHSYRHAQAASGPINETARRRFAYKERGMKNAERARMLRLKCALTSARRSHV